MRRRSVTLSSQPWPTPTTRADAKAIEAQLAEATSSSSSATTAPPKSGRSLASSSATCGSTTTCRSATSAPPPTSRKPAWCATCSTRPSIPFGQSKRRSRFAATQASGWRSSAASPAFTWRAKSIVARTTGRSGAGIDSALATLSVPHKLPRRNSRSSRSDLGRRLRHLQGPPVAALDLKVLAACRQADLVLLLRMARRRATPAPAARTLQALGLVGPVRPVAHQHVVLVQEGRVALAHPVPAVLAVRPHRARVAHRDAPLDRPIRAEYPHFPARLTGEDLTTP